MAVLTSIEDVQPFINRETLEVDIESLKKDELLLIAEYGGYVLQIKLKQLENEAKEKDREDREKERKHEERQREHEERQREHEERQREHELKLAQLKFGVPEAYRQKFRELKKASNETYSEFARCKERLFEDWCNSRKVGNMQDMRELILLEEFKNCVPKDLKAHLEETQVETLKVAAELLDDSSLTHKKVYEEWVSNSRSDHLQAWELAKDTIVKSQRKMKEVFDVKTKCRTFKEGDKVLILLPLVENQLQAKFVGPYEIEKKINDSNYVVNTPDRKKKQWVCHVNMLKLYCERKVEPSMLIQKS
ncbi:uncharacterized protein [Macrobrachium rosenbergii]|uniref:uncharacterized protein n=1 Tax=Macrobrachium rosenbergii TaxID=79674 RepID=UPI0034D5C848